MRLQLLLVDHSVYILERLQDLLSPLAVVQQLYQATSFEEAMTVVEQHDIQVAVIDIDLVENRGLLLLQVLKQDFPEIKVVMLLNSTLMFYHRLCSRIGADACLDKANEFERIPSLLEQFAQPHSQVDTDGKPQ